MTLYMGVEKSSHYNNLFSLNSLTVAWRSTFCHTKIFRDEPFLQGFLFLVFFFCKKEYFIDFF